MRGGHNVKPETEKKLNGTYRPSRHGGRMETHTKTVESIPPAPLHFDERHAQKWDECCKLMLDAGVLANMDLDAVSLYVENWFMAADAYEDLRANGMTVWVEKYNKEGKLESKRPMTNPAFRQYQDCQKILTPLMQQFGFTPKSRMSIRLDAPKTKKESPILALLSKRKTGTNG